MNLMKLFKNNFRDIFYLKIKRNKRLIDMFSLFKHANFLKKIKNMLELRHYFLYNRALLTVMPKKKSHVRKIKI